MNTMIQHITLIDRIDQLVRLQATGTPEALSTRLGISKTKLYRTINTMRALEAPILYDMSLQSYIYEEQVGFRFGFYEQINKRV